MERKNQKYFLLNINEGEKNNKKNTVKNWMEKGFAPIFYDNWTIEQIKNKQTTLKSLSGNETLKPRQIV